SINGNILCLGISHGTNEFINTNVQNKIDEWNKELKLIFSLDDQHIKFYILMKYQNISKMNYLLRNLNLIDNKDIIKELERIKLLILENMVPFTLNHDQIMQSELEVNFGGIACRNVKQLLCASYLSRVSALNNSIKKKDLVDEITYNNVIYKQNEIIEK